MKRAPRKCSACQKPGHIARNCPDAAAGNGGASPPPSGPKRATAPPTLVSAEDLPVVKTAVVGIVTALEKVPPQHRDRVMRSAQMILGGVA